MHRFIILWLVPIFGSIWAAPSAKADAIISEAGTGSTASPQPIVIEGGTAPTVVVIRQGSAEKPRPASAPPKHVDRERKVGLHVNFGGTLGPRLTLGGVSGALRIRPVGFVAIDLGAGYFAGYDYDGDFRTEVPITTNLLFYLNPKSRFQFYILLGGGVTLGTKEAPFEERDLIHVGGQAGLGVELRIAKAFALNADVRGVMRYRVDDDPRPEIHRRRAVDECIRRRARDLWRHLLLLDRVHLGTD